MKKTTSLTLRQVYDELDDMFFVSNPTKDDIAHRDELRSIEQDANTWCMGERFREKLQEKYPEWDESVCDIPRYDYANISIDGVTPSSYACGVYYGPRNSTPDDIKMRDVVSNIMRVAKDNGIACRRWSGDGYNFESIIENHRIVVFEYSDLDRLVCKIYHTCNGAERVIYEYQGDGSRSWVAGNRKGERLYNDTDSAERLLIKLWEEINA